jgi:hypothetical protein
MKSVTLALLALSTLGCIAADPTPAPGVPIDAKVAQTIQSYDVAKIAEKGPALAGQIVKVKFNYRSREAGKEQDGKFHGTLRIWRTTNNVGNYSLRSGGLAVIVPPEAEAWFLKLPTDDASRASLIVIARLGANPDAPAELLGREIKTDMKGPKIVW